MARLGCIAVIMTVLSGPAIADIVNVQSVLSGDAPAGLSGSVTGSADWRTGNTNLLLLSAAPTARLRMGRHLLVVIAKGDLGRTKVAGATSTIVKKTFEHLRYRYAAHRRVLAEAFAQHAFDEFRRLELRAVVGAGAKLTLLSRAGFDVGLGIAYMLEYERLDDGYRDPGAGRLVHRASSYLTGRYALDDRVSIVETVYVQPRLDHASDTRLLDDTALVIKLTTRVALKSTLTITYDGEPPQPMDPTDTAIESLDTSLKTSITVGF